LVHPSFSEEMLEEYAAVLARPKFAFPPDEIPSGKIAAVLAMFRQQGELHHPTTSLAASVDPGDTKFLQCAGRLYCHRQQAAFSPIG
jgi:predicted nucleic acid-binding protein